MSPSILSLCFCDIIPFKNNSTKITFINFLWYIDSLMRIVPGIVSALASPSKKTSLKAVKLNMLNQCTQHLKTDIEHHQYL